MQIRALLFFLTGLTFAAPALTFSTYLRSGFTPKAMATDSAGNVYLAGNSQNMALLVKLNPAATQYLYVRYLGGSVGDYANALAVDASGNAYVAGYTNSPDFPATSGAFSGGPQSFVAKFDPSGELVFADLLGWSAASQAQAVTVNASGQVIVSGTTGAGFPSTAGAFVGPPSVGLYLMELDSTGTKTVFSATGIGGTALAVDSSGNIYVAGTTTLTNYPTTAGSYQPVFPVFQDCPSPDCFMSTPGLNQYLTKLDPTAARLIYSTSVSGNGDMVNAGLAVDSAGSAYLTGYHAAQAPPTEGIPQMPFLDKIDAAGQTLVFSIPVGGAGVQVDSNGAVYVAGNVGPAARSPRVATNIPALANVPAPCLGGIASSYAAQVDAATGALLGSQLITESTNNISRGGTTILLSALARVASTVWVAGSATLPGFPTTPGALLDTKSGPGAYLGAIDFSQVQTQGPQIACVVDSATFGVPGPVARSQLLTIFGTSLGGASVMFGSTAAPVLYSSATQINFAVPALSSSAASGLLQVGATSLTFPLTSANPSLFSVILNADGSQNSSSHPAALGSNVSVFVNGLSGLTPQFPPFSSTPAQLFTDNGWSVASIAQATPYVLKVDMRVPQTTASYYCGTPATSPCAMNMALYYFDLTPPLFFPPAESLTGFTAVGQVYVALP
jgi:hypothetical protein